MNFQDELSARTLAAEAIIRQSLPAAVQGCETLTEAMRYAVEAGGKRLRPVLMHETWQLLGGQGEEIGAFMAGMEMIHTHSLIHDDLPALDNDDYRRGRLTTHRAYGEAMGILAGDALLNYAYETMLGAFSVSAHPDRVARTLQLIAGKTGIHGMLGGQSVDVENDGKPLGEETLLYIYEHKTSALIEASMAAGAILAGAGQEELALVTKAAGLTGMAFQIRDDILDVISTDRELGKPVGSDEKNHKTTYVTLFGLDEAEEKVRQLSDEAVDLLRCLKKDSLFLEELIGYLAARKY